MLRNYINGFKKPSVECKSTIFAHIHKLGKEMMAVCNNTALYIFRSFTLDCMFESIYRYSSK